MYQMAITFILKAYLYSILEAFIYGKVERLDVMPNELLQGLQEKEIELFIIILTLITCC